MGQKENPPRTHHPGSLHLELNFQYELISDPSGMHISSTVQPEMSRIRCLFSRKDPQVALGKSAFFPQISTYPICQSQTFQQRPVKKHLDFNGHTSIEHRTLLDQHILNLVNEWSWDGCSMNRPCLDKRSLFISESTPSKKRTTVVCEVSNGFKFVSLFVEHQDETSDEILGCPSVYCVVYLFKSTVWNLEVLLPACVTTDFRGSSTIDLYGVTYSISRSPGSIWSHQRGKASIRKQKNSLIDSKHVRKEGHSKLQFGSRKTLTKMEKHRKSEMLNFYLLIC